MGQIWSQIVQLFFLDIWDVPWRVSMSTTWHCTHRGTFICQLRHISIVSAAEAVYSHSVPLLGHKTPAFSVSFVGTESARTSGVAWVLPLQTHVRVSEVGGRYRHDQCKITLQVQHGIGPFKCTTSDSISVLCWIATALLVSCSHPVLVPFILYENPVTGLAWAL